MVNLPTKGIIPIIIPVTNHPSSTSILPNETGIKTRIYYSLFPNSIDLFVTKHITSTLHYHYYPPLSSLYYLDIHARNSQGTP